MCDAKLTQKIIIEPPYFSNWVDLFIPKIANMILPLVPRYKWIKLNIVTLFSIFLHVLGCLFIFIKIPYYLYYTTFLLPLAYICDCHDGQLARTKNFGSDIGNYLDKVVDVLIIYTITICLGYNTYVTINNALYIFLGITACFFFNYRYYINLETIFSRFNQDSQYLVKSSDSILELYQMKKREYERISVSF